VVAAAARGIHRSKGDHEGGVGIMKWRIFVCGPWGSLSWLCCLVLLLYFPWGENGNMYLREGDFGGVHLGIFGVILIMRN